MQEKERSGQKGDLLGILKKIQLVTPAECVSKNELGVGKHSL